MGTGNRTFYRTPVGPIELLKKHRPMEGQERKHGEERGRHNACLGYRRARSHSMPAEAAEQLTQVFTRTAEA